jgi:hypothetical protein
LVAQEDPVLPRLLLRALVIFVVAGPMLGCSSESTAPLARIPEGNWGGERIGLFVDEAGVSFLFDCAGGRVDHPVTLDASGNFDVVGTYAESGNAINADHSPHPARYVGHTTRTRLDVTRTILDRADPAVSFSATRGIPPMIVAC